MKGKLIKIDNTYILTTNLYEDEVFAIADFDKAKSLDKHKLSLENCQAIENGYDLDELVKEEAKKRHDWNKHRDTDIYNELIREDAELIKIGFQKALELLGDKKYTETELYHAFLINSAGNNTTLRNFFEQTVLPMIQQTEWDVEIVMDRDCYGNAGRCDKLTMSDCIICTPVTYLKDANGCLILRRK